MGALVVKGVEAERMTTAAFGADRSVCKDNN
jgi:hypothetical protein